MSGNVWNVSNVNILCVFFNKAVCGGEQHLSNRDKLWAGRSIKDSKIKYINKNTRHGSELQVQMFQLLKGFGTCVFPGEMNEPGCVFVIFPVCACVCRGGRGLPWGGRPAARPGSSPGPGGAGRSAWPPPGPGESPPAAASRWLPPPPETQP